MAIAKALKAFGQVSHHSEDCFAFGRALGTERYDNPDFPKAAAALRAHGMIKMLLKIADYKVRFNRYCSCCCSGSK